MSGKIIFKIRINKIIKNRIYRNINNNKLCKKYNLYLRESLKHQVLICQNKIILIDILYNE